MLNFDKEYYSTGAYDAFDQRYFTIEKPLIESLLKATSASPTDTFLDIGCGLGGYVLALREKGYEAYGTDISDYALQNSPAAQWTQKASMTQLPFADQSFDVVMSITSLYYLSPEDQQKAAAEMTRVARKWIYFDTISLGSKNADHEFNPDSERDNSFLLSSKKNLELFTKRGFIFEKHLFTDGAEIEPAEGLYKRKV